MGIVNKIFGDKKTGDVKGYVDQGQFGIWEETGRNINLAIVVGAYEGKGYGESVGSIRCACFS